MMLTRCIETISTYQVLTGVVICVGIILYYEGIGLIKAVQVSALELSTPFFAAILAFFILREYLTVMQYVGMFFYWVAHITCKKEVV